MSNAVWPADLPQTFNTDGYSMTWPDELQRTQTDAGPGKVRRRGPNVAKVSGSMLMTQTQVISFKSFFETTLKGGALVFDWTTQRPDDAAATAYTYRFGSPPRFQPTAVSTKWLVQLELEQLP